MPDLVIAGTAVAAVTYAFMLYGAWVGASYQNPATFLMWGLLNIIAATSYALQGSTTWVLIAFYAFASLAMCWVLSRKGWRRWDLKEWIAAAMVASSVIGWYFSGELAAAVMSTTGIVVAAIPLCIDLWRDPRKSPFEAYIWLTLANGLTFAAARDWSLKEVFYPGACVVLMIFTDWLSARQFFRPFRQQSAH